MKIIRFVPIILSFLILSAHFTRSGLYPIVIVCILLIFLLLIRKSWVARLLQICLILGAFEWIRTMYFFVIQRQEYGMSWIRLAIILGIVSFFTGLSALIFQTKEFKKRYSLNKSEKQNIGLRVETCLLYLRPTRMA